MGGIVQKKTSNMSIARNPAGEVDDNLPPPPTPPTNTDASRASIAATKSRKKASKAADQTSHAAKTVAQTKAATKASLARAKRGHPKSALSRAVIAADREAKIAEKAAKAAEQMALRAANLATETELAAAGAREAETMAIKVNAQLASPNSLVASFNNGEKQKFGRNAGPSFEAPATWNQRGPTGIYKVEDTHIFSSNLYMTGTWSKVDGTRTATSTR